MSPFGQRTARDYAAINFKRINWSGGIDSDHAADAALRGVSLVEFNPASHMGDGTQQGNDKYCAANLCQKSNGLDGEETGDASRDFSSPFDNIVVFF